LVLPTSLRSFDGVVGRDLLGQWEYFLYRGRRSGSAFATDRVGLSDG